LSKVMVQSAGCEERSNYGGVMVTVVLLVAVWPLSSDTLQVIPTAPVGAPVEEKDPCAAAGDGAGLSRVAVGQRTILRDQPGCSNRGAFAA